jgi:hypothetical protein
MIPSSLPWYESEADFQAILSILPIEESKNPLSYQEMLVRLEELEKQQVNAGQMVQRIVIKPAAIKEWCDKFQRKVCRGSIRDYAGFKMAELVASKGQN